jgi:alanine-alpha-ketoisovalerate/valine-pyruvate aminotransferase
LALLPGTHNVHQQLLKITHLSTAALIIHFCIIRAHQTNSAIFVWFWFQWLTAIKNLNRSGVPCSVGLVLFRAAGANWTLMIRLIVVVIRTNNQHQKLCAPSTPRATIIQQIFKKV